MQVALFMVLVLTVPAARPALAAASPPAPAHIPSARAIAAPPLAAWTDKVWSKITSLLNSRSGAIQAGLIIMLIALWIIWWRK